MAEYNAAIELHDSTLVRFEDKAGGFVVTMHAYVHRSAGQPGVDAGTGWIQTTELRFAHGQVTKGKEVDLPLWISEGFFEVGPHVEEHGLSIPFGGGDITALEVVGTTGETIRVEGTGGTIAMVGEAKFVEEYTAD